MDLERAWAAGFLNQSRSGISVQQQSGRNPLVPFRRPIISITRPERDDLDRFRHAIGVGTVYTRHKRRGQATYRFVVETRTGVELIVMLLWDDLDDATQDALIRVLTTPTAQIPYASEIESEGAIDLDDLDII